MKKPFKVTPKERKKIIELLNETKNAAKVARAFSRDVNTISNIAKKNGISLLGNRIPPEERQEIIKSLKEKKNLKEVAKIFGRRSSTLSKIAASHKIKLKHKRKKRKS